MLVSCLTLTLQAAQADRIKDLAQVRGVRDNPLVGYGLVVGLDGSGDQTTQAPFTGQSLTNMLSQLGVTVPSGTNMQLKNVAAVMVTASLPAFASSGQPIDVVVSSLGNAKSLRGGTLLMTPLKGVDGQVYALAQGNLIIGGAGASAGGSSVQVNQLTAGRIPSGATVERGVPTRLGDENGVIHLDLFEGDFNHAQNVASAINRNFGGSLASPLSSRDIVVQAPRDLSQRVGFIARLENIEVALGVPRARVVVNARTGSVVMNSEVRLARAAVTHGNLSVVIDANPVISQPAPLSQGQTAVVNDPDISVNQQGGALRMVEGTASLQEVVDGLNALGATPQDLVSILEALKAAGALRADLEVI
ncbi:MAG: flagellar basal body P-ring protein FlgI [Cobetia sp.]|uniref:Flagellar P-ring protein n=2 Tax=Cobetia amphilecti TaxID=1055104 RepID=A0ABT6UJ84_9GAMM|nr:MULTISPECIES: flagellar basal body P-ring protein FlgI [Cobetia]MDH2293915.1 flagellar basal body P-ring protein FlgI [Cobetia sp. 1AS1]MDI5882754.1 flagellar basal body P-ring protein FlgI [Cobetia amphilecti]MDO6814696.1 flagellar basal body P-ring protein FlgI [Cobetia amphilecti]